MLARQLQTLSPMQLIADTSGGYNNPLFYLIAKLNKGKSKQWDYEKYEYAIMGNRTIIETITSVTQSGNNLVVTYVPSAAGVDPFRTNWILLDSSMKRGRIISHSLGSVTLEPDGTALSAATDFQATTFIKNGWNASTNRESRKTEDLTYTQETDFNLAAVSRNTKYIDAEDKIHTRPQIYGNDIWYGQEKLGIQDWVNQLTKRWLVDERAVVQGYDGKRNTCGGILWSVANRGGSVIPANGLFTLADFQDIIMDIRNKDASPNLHIDCFLGSSVLGELQKAIGTQIQYSGKNNTFGGDKVKGIDVDEYKYVGVSLSFLQFPEFNNPMGLFSDPASYNSSITAGNNSALFINTAEIPTIDGGSVPVMELFHRTSRPVYYKHIPGMIDAGKVIEVVDFDTPESGLASSDLPGTTALMYHFGGLNIRDAKGMVYWKG
ncbi:MAG: hypothetical protein AABY40_01660 [Nanoarchaeota archaeon]